MAMDQLVMNQLGMDRMGRSPIASSDPRGSCHRLARRHAHPTQSDWAARLVPVVPAPPLAVVGARAAVARGPRGDACAQQPRDAPSDWQTQKHSGAMASVDCPSGTKIRAVPANRLLHPTANRCGHPPSDPPHPGGMPHQNDPHPVVPGEHRTRHQRADGPYPAIDPSVDRRDQDCAGGVVDVNP